jgi:hypothetical protein
MVPEGAAMAVPGTEEEEEEEEGNEEGGGGTGLKNGGGDGEFGLQKGFCSL